MFDLLLRVFLNKIEKEEDLNPGWNPDLSYPGARFSKVPVTLRARNQIFKSKYKE